MYFSSPLRTNCVDTFTEAALAAEEGSQWQAKRSLW